MVINSYPVDMSIRIVWVALFKAIYGKNIRYLVSQFTQGEKNVEFIFKKL